MENAAMDDFFRVKFPLWFPMNMLKGADGYIRIGAASGEKAHPIFTTQELADLFMAKNPGMEKDYKIGVITHPEQLLQFLDSFESKGIHHVAFDFARAKTGFHSISEVREKLRVLLANSDSEKN